MKYIKRQLEKIILDYTEKYNVVFIAGGIGIGKTTMLRHLADETQRSYIDLGDVEIATRLKECRSKFFTDSNSKSFIIDNVEEMPELAEIIRETLDTSDKTFWIAGIPLKSVIDKFKVCLQNEVIFLKLYQSSQREFENICLNEDIIFEFDDLVEREKMFQKRSIEDLYLGIWQGSSFELRESKDIRNTKYYEDYINKVIFKNINRIGSENIDKFREFIYVCVSCFTRVLNYEMLTDRVGIKKITVSKWLAILQEMGVIHLLHAYNKKRSSGFSKVYVCDSGLVAYTMNYNNIENMIVGTMSRELFENYVIIEFIKNYSYLYDDENIFYYHISKNTYVPIVYIAENKMHPIEVNNGIAIPKKLIENLSKVDDINTKRANGLIVSLAKEVYPIPYINDIRIPWYMV